MNISLVSKVGSKMVVGALAVVWASGLTGCWHHRRDPNVEIRVEDRHDGHEIRREERHEERHER